MELSDTARQFLAGILDHAKAFTAIVNPTVNSYKRLVPGYEAPVYIAWSGRNRSPLIRVPQSRGMSTRVELRSVDPSANPYLAMAVLLKAGLDGVKNKMEAPVPINRNIYVMSEKDRYENGIYDLPGTLHEALGYLAKDNTIKAGLGDHIYENFVNAKKIEWAAFREQVTEWEREQYLKLY